MGQQACDVRVVNGTPKLLEQEPSLSQSQGVPLTDEGLLFTLVTRTRTGVAEFVKAEFQV